MKTLRVLKYAGFGILGIAFMIGLIFGVQALWNWLIPELFNGPALSFWQTIGLFILSKILLTGVAPGSGHNHKRDWRKKYGEKYWERYSEKCRERAENGRNIETAEQI
jgi:hypothetical protein